MLDRSDPPLAHATPSPFHALSLSYAHVTEQLFHELEQKFLAAKSELAVVEAEKQDATNAKHAARTSLSLALFLFVSRDCTKRASKDERDDNSSRSLLLDRSRHTCTH